MDVLARAFKSKRSKAGNSKAASTMNEEPIGPFAYTPLPENCIRLLNIQSLDRPNRIIFAKLEHYPLNELPKFKAVSHTWVDPVDKDLWDGKTVETSTPRYQIAIDDECKTEHLSEFGLEAWVKRLPPQKKVLASENISALFSCQAEEIMKNDRFWIDCICINQSDAEEVASQILLMGDIYHSANTVLAWLGPSVQDLDLFEWAIENVLPAMNRAVATRLNELGSYDRVWAWLQDSNPFDKQFWLYEMRLVLNEPYNWEDFWLCYCRFFQYRQLWKRAWVYQELALATHIEMATGSKLFKYNDVWALERYMWKANWFYYINIKSPLAVPKYKFKSWNQQGNIFTFIAANYSVRGIDMLSLNSPSLSGNLLNSNPRWPYSMLVLLSNIRDLRATFPQDMVLSVLGIIKKTMPKEKSEILRANFKDAKEVYTWSCKIMIENGPMTLLQMVQDPDDQKVKDLPSWVVDWSIGASANFSLKGYDATKAWDGVFTQRAGVRDNVLHTFGTKFDSIVGAIKWNHFLKIGKEKPEITYVFLAELLDLWGVSNERLNTQRDTIADQLMEATFFSLYQGRRTGDYESNRNGLTWYLDILAEHDESTGSREKFAWRHLRTLENEGHTLVSKHRQPEYVRGFEVALDSYLQNRSLFICSRGLLGNGSYSVKAGDEVWLVPLLNAPLVFRPKETDGEFELLAAAYVNGIMHGEVKREMLDEPRLMRII